MLNKPYKMNLQLFAEGEAEPEVTSEPPIEQPKTYTEDEVKKMVQAEADRMTTKGLQTAREKWEAEQEQKLQQAKELAELSAEERAKKEFELERESFLKEKAEIIKERLTLQTEKDLISKGLPPDFATMLVAENPEVTLKNINMFEQKFRAALEVAIDERVKGRTPTKGSNDGDKQFNPWAKESFNLTEQGKILKEDPVLAERLRKSAGK
ncbi:MAG: DUF4355 domain-containing protein [Candidatus Riflebacteria bacterium]|nr:DUF4355 domain-containing protein [Candidatus Riflebacteria bacterium]